MRLSAANGTLLQRGVLDQRTSYPRNRGEARQKAETSESARNRSGIQAAIHSSAEGEREKGGLLAAKVTDPLPQFLIAWMGVDGGRQRRNVPCESLCQK